MDTTLRIEIFRSSQAEESIYLLFGDSSALIKLMHLAHIGSMKSKAPIHLDMVNYTRFSLQTIDSERSSYLQDRRVREAHVDHPSHSSCGQERSYRAERHCCRAAALLERRHH